MSRITVIVPVYKVEAYLKRCVDSLLCQTYENFFLLLVDDGSPDCCGEICDAYMRQDARVHVLHQKNAGLSAARNAGIEWALSRDDVEWISFVDSDDWVQPV
ncbi:MAG: glycosyltransferase family 2 protein, partial [Oscillospiraceae bacterium]|nr:glycosyltransferase family 2 protein [Oscillospiraceae bacterium]